MSTSAWVPVDEKSAWKPVAESTPAPENKEDSFWQGVKDVPGAVLHSLAHPLDTIQAMGKQVMAGGSTPYGAPINAPTGNEARDAANQQAIVSAQKEQADAFAAHPKYAAGQLAGQAAISLAGEGLGLPEGFSGSGEGALPGAARALSEGAKEIGTSAGSKLLPALIDGPPESLITRAIKPGKNNVNWNADAQRAIPLMKSAETQLGRPISGIDDALEANAIAKKGIWDQYKARLGPAAQMGATIDGNQIADAMMSSIDERTATQNPGLVAKVKSVADTYRNPMTLDQAEDFLQSANKDLNSYYAKNKVGQRVAQNDPEISSTVAEAGALRDALYAKLDQVSGPAAAQLKQAYGSLSNVEKELYGRQLVAARQNPESLAQQISTAQGVGDIAKNVMNLDLGSAISGTAKMTAAKLLKERNTSDAMITRAFEKASPAQPFPAPSSPRIGGLLQRGPIQTPAPSDNSGSVPFQAPPVAATTRAQRLGLMLPDRTGGPIELPYVPEMSGGDRLAALMHYLRNNKPPIALPEKASPIQLPPGS